MMTANDDADVVDVKTLLSTCVDAALRGCAEIRRVQKARDEAASDDEDAFVVTRKVATDPRSALTEADVAAQSAVVSALRASWPRIRIVGEEDENEDAAPMSPKKGAPLRTGLCDEAYGASGDERLKSLKVDAADVTLFIDPVDGTREFVESRLHAVQCLIGVAVRGRAVAGAIGLPFPDGDVATSDACVVFGAAAPGAKRGVFGVHGARGNPRPIAYDDPTARVRSVAGDSKNAALTAAKEIVKSTALANSKSHSHGVIGGAGNKILAVAEGRAEYALMHFGTSLWDTCAPEAVLRAAGGKVTDLYGAPLMHYAESPGGLINQLGVVGSGPNSPDGVTHDELCAEMRRNADLKKLIDRFTAGDSSVVTGGDDGQACDVARCLGGAPLRTKDVGQQITSAIGVDGVQLVGYAAPESDAVRGLMSDACRLYFKWSSDEDARLPRSAFYKKVDMGNLEYMRTKQITQPLKIARDSKSYAVESSFLASKAAKALEHAGIGVPICYAADLRPTPSDPIESKFSLLVEDFHPDDGWEQARMLAPDQAKCALQALARMHAFFLPGSHFRKSASDDDEDVLNVVWNSGGYWQPDMQPPEQMDIIESAWETHMQSFGAAIDAEPTIDASIAATVGARLQAHAKRIGAETHPFSACPGAEDVLRRGGARLAALQTIIHGDPKSGNIFERRREDDDSWEIGLIDFQWTGVGLGGTDLGHFVCASVAPEGLSADGVAENALVDAYYEAFSTAAVEFGAASSVETVPEELLTREELQVQYENGVLDTMRCVFGYQWLRVKASPESLAKNAKSIGRNSYNKSLPNALWMIRTADLYLKSREARVGGGASS
jgi:3'-phosphoadenosine 5'-phosphosulfate (PAPS) 3'-phosphatase